MKKYELNKSTLEQIEKQEYVEGNPDLRSLDEFLKEQAAEASKIRTAEDEEERRQEHCIDLARRYSGLSPKQAFDKSRQEADELARERRLGVKAADKNEFLADLEEGKQRLAARHAENARRRERTRYFNSL